MGCWWAVQTVTTVGYGDVTIRTDLGYVVGAITAVTGIIMVAIPISVIRCVCVACVCVCVCASPR